MNAKSNEYVSVILPTYNRSHVIADAIQSVLSQTYPYLELIIIDDGSTDNTEEIINQFSDPRIRYYKLEQNSGQAAARNYGIQKATYEYLAFQDSDDLWYPQKLALQIQAFENVTPQVGLIYHKLQYNLPNNAFCILPDEKIALEKKNGDIYNQLLWDNLVGMPAILTKKECIRTVGLMDTSMNCLEDYDWVLRICKRYHAVFIDEVLLDAGYSTTGVSGNSYNYLLASCTLISKYKQDYLQTNTLNHRLECILNDASKLGAQDQFVKLLEKIMLL